MQLLPPSVQHTQMSFDISFNSSTPHNHTQQQLQQPQHQRRKTEVKMPHSANFIHGGTSTKTATPVLKLPKELHLKIFGFLNPIDGTCLSLTCSLLYIRSPLFPNRPLVPRDSPFIFFPSLQIPASPPPLPLNTGSPDSRNPVVQARGCRFCLPVLHYPAHCELHFHVQGFMVEGMKYCAGGCEKYTYSLAKRRQGRGKAQKIRIEESDSRRLREILSNGGSGGESRGGTSRRNHLINEREESFEVEEIEDVNMEDADTNIPPLSQFDESSSLMSISSRLFRTEAAPGAGFTFPFSPPGNPRGSEQNQQAQPPRISNGLDRLSPGWNIRPPTPSHYRGLRAQSQLRLPPQQDNPPVLRPNTLAGFQYLQLPPPPQPEQIPPHLTQYNYQSRCPAPIPVYDNDELCGGCLIPYNKPFERGRRMLDTVRSGEGQRQVRRWYKHEERLSADGGS